MNSNQQVLLLRRFRLVSLGVGVGLFAAGGILLSRSAIFVHCAERADAEGISVESPSGQGCVYRPTIRYTDASGQQHTVEFDHSASIYNYCVGQHKMILYSPASPQKVRIDSFLGVWAVSLLIIGLGSGFLLAALVTAKMLRVVRESAGEGARLR
jgi:hypothetical protein